MNILNIDMSTIVMILLKKVFLIYFIFHIFHIFKFIIIFWTELFHEELTKIATDEIFDETCQKLQTKLLTSFIDHDFVPQIVIESHQEIIDEQAGQVNHQDQVALESKIISY